MRTCRSSLGAYIWDQRSNRGIKRTKLARMIDCQTDSIALLEDRGEDIEGILPKLIEVLELDPTEIEKRNGDDHEIRLNWIRWCGQKKRPILIAARQPICCPVTIPEEIIAAGNEAIEAHALTRARKWNRTIELFLGNHIRMRFNPQGIIEINELGFYEPWLIEKVER
jgi:hypothetical protein